MIKNYLKITWKVLKRKKIYTIVTMAGIIIPVTFIVLITSFFVHLNNFNPPKSKFKKVLYLDDVTWKEIKEDGKSNQRMTNPPNYWFIEKHVKTLDTPILVGSISSNSFSGAEIIYTKDKPLEVVIKSTDSEFWRITDFKFIQGRAFNKSEFGAKTNMAIIDKKTSYSLFGTSESAGKNIEIKNKKFKIVGVIENVDITMHRLHANIYLPFSVSDNYLSNSIFANFSRAFILVDDLNDLPKLDREFQQQLKTVSFEGANKCNHIEGSFLKENYLSKIKNLTASLLHFRGNSNNSVIIASILLIFFFIILPSINLININVNRIYERFSEIGVRKTFGASVNKLIWQFLFENVTITFIGGIVSIVISVFLITIINRTDALGIYIRFNLPALLISLLSIFLLSILSGLIPTIKMARSKIINSLSSSESK